MKHTILFLAANPLATDRLALDEECAAIERKLRVTSGHDSFDFRSKWVVSVEELMRHLNELQPAILHFSGHGSITAAGSIVYFSGHGSASTAGSSYAQGDPHRRIEAPRGTGIFLQDKGSSQYVKERALAKVIESASPSTRVVVLNACFSAPVAESLRHVVDCVVGMDGVNADAAARSFAVAFYRALGNRRSVGNAVAQAVATLAVNRLPGHLPVCRTRDGLSAEQIFLPTLGQDRPDPAEPQANRAGATSAPASQPSRLSASTADPLKVDVGILTIRDDEFRAVLAAFPRKAGSRKGPRREYTLRHADAGNGEQYTVAVLRPVEQGNGKAQDAAGDLIEDFAPRLLLLVGIASGLPSDDVTLGDVVVSTRIHDFTVEARRSEQEPTYAATGGPVANALASFITNLPAREDELGDWTADLPPRPPVTWTRERQLYGPPEWQRELWAKLEHHHGEGSTPRAPVYAAGPIASSDRLMKKPELLIPWLQTARHLLAVEMESVGVFRAAQERCPMLAIRGISDIVGLSRADAWTRFACASAAAFTCAFLRMRPVPVGVSLPTHRFKEAFGVMWDGRHFDADLAEASEVTIAFVDMNGTKQINDTEGHAAGDDAIRRYLGVVQEVVGAAGTCYRRGGDEIVISFPDTTAVAARGIMLSALAKLGDNDTGRRLTASCGLAARRSGESARQVLARADQAMCVAKEMSTASSPRRSVVCVDGVAPTALD